MKQRQAQMAMQQAVGRERFKYVTAFCGLLATILPVAAFKTHNPALVFPLVPLSIFWAFQYDMLYGNLMLRAQVEAARTIKEEPERYFLPTGTGIVDQGKYNKIIGQDENYKPILNQTDSVFTTLHKNAMGSHVKSESQQLSQRARS